MGGPSLDPDAVLCGPGPITETIENSLTSMGWSYFLPFTVALAAQETHRPITCVVNITHDTTQPIRSVHYDEH